MALKSAQPAKELFGGMDIQDAAAVFDVSDECVLLQVEASRNRCNC